MTIVEFLTARIDEDEARTERLRELADTVGRIYGSPEPPEGDLNPADRAYFAMHEQASRVLVDIAAKRRLVDELLPELVAADRLIAGEWGDDDDLAGKLAQALAQPYADHPDYRLEWQL